MRTSLLIISLVLVFGYEWGMAQPARSGLAGSSPPSAQRSAWAARMAARPVFPDRVPPSPAERAGEAPMATGAGFQAGGGKLTLFRSARAARQTPIGAPANTLPQQPAGVAPEGSAPAPVPEAVDPTTLMVSKTANGTNWTINLSWSGGTSPYTVSYCQEPSFQREPQTLAEGVSNTAMSTPAVSTAALECYAVTDATTVSQAVQGMGYDPTPAPTDPTVSANGLWWGDSVTFTSNNLDPNPTGDLVQMGDRIARAASTSGGSPFATSATFTVPDDARGFYGFIEAHGRDASTAPYVGLTPRGIGPFTGITGLAYAPQTGHVWIAAQGIIEEVDLFEQDPAVLTHFTDVSEPYLSRVSSTGLLVYVDAAAPGMVYQIDVTTGARTSYAFTTDSGFTRTVLPVGIAIDPDGSVCYIADASAGLLVQIPQNNASSITDNWGNLTWNFPTPCGMDVNVGHQVVASSANDWIGYTTDQNDTYLLGYTQDSMESIQIDPDASTAAEFFTNFTDDPALTEAFNLNPIAGAPAADHGAMLFGLTNGLIDTEADWSYYIGQQFPARVLIDSAGQNLPYPTPVQQQDRIISMPVYGWAGTRARLRVIDPPDFSPYVPDGGCLQGGCTQVLPYEGNDNTSSTGYGVGLAADGSDAAPTQIVTFPSSGGGETELMVYLTVPAQGSGNNFQVEITKCDPSGTVLPNRVCGLSGLYTTWKRIYVERDHMFRRGGIIYAPDNLNGDNIIPTGRTSLYMYKGPGGTQIDNLSVGDEIAIFDTQRPFEGPHDTAYVGQIDRTSNPDYAIVPLVQADLTTPYATQYSYTASAIDSSTHYPNFDPTQGNCAGVGVVHSADGLITDTDPNQINGAGSAFYDADMREIEQPFDDAYVEFVGLRSGMGAVPYVHWTTVLSLDQIASQLIAFEKIWFVNQGKINYLHLLGIEDGDPYDAGSIGGSPFDGTNTQTGASCIYVQKIITLNPGDPATQAAVAEYCTVHELTHNFSIQGLSKDTYHCGNMAWPLASDVPEPHECIMNEDLSANPPKGFVTYTTSPPRFCMNHLFTGGTLVDVQTSIRDQQDPLPY